MRITEMVLLCLVCFLFLLGTRTTPQKEAQEATIQDERIVEDGRTFSVVYRAQDPEEEPVVDILWMKRAARIALEEGIPHFNVIHQKISKRYRPKFQQELSTMEGTILLESDPMKAEYDAQEIDSLVLTDEVVEREEEEAPGRASPE